jgi:flagellar hook protein FlgE
MGLQSALSTALTGLTAAETTIDVVGNNLANSNTVGFKASTASFSTQFLQTMAMGSGPTENTGGTNPRQVGMGTMVSDITPSFSQGTLEISSSPTDLAIQGDGFFVVEGSSGEELYTRNGIFKLNSQSEMVTITGNRLLGFGIDEDFQIQRTTLEPITIPLGAAAVAQPTGNVFLEGTLRPEGDVAVTAQQIRTGILGNALYEAPLSQATVSQATAPSMVAAGTAAAEVAGAGVPAGDYEYKFVWASGAFDPMNLMSESAPSDSVTVTVAAPNSVQLTNIPPVPPSAAYDHVRIYRSRTDVVPSTSFQYVDEVSVGTATYTDSTAPAGLGAPLDETLLSGNYRYYVTFADRVGGWGQGEETRPSPVTDPLNIVNGRVLLTDLPVTTDPAAWNVRRIYRNLSSDDSTFYYVGEIGNATDPTATISDNMSDADLLANNEVIDMDGPEAMEGTLLTDLLLRDGSTYNQVFQEGVLEFTGRKGGRSLSMKEFTIESTTTVGNLITFMDQAMGIQSTTNPLDPIPRSTDGTPSGVAPGGSIVNGQIVFTGNNGVDNAIDIGLSGMLLRTASGTENINIPWGVAQEAVGESAVTDFLVYDSLGIPLRVRMTAVLETRDSTSTTYRWFADSPDNDPTSGAEIAVGTGRITFDGEGNLVGVSEATVSLERRNVSSASPLEFEMDFSNISGLAADSSSLAVSRQDGSGPGVLTSFIAGENGIIRGVFSNGVTRDLGQIRLARFANPAGLEQRGENLYAGGVNSGLPVQANPGQQGIGTIISGAVELSNTDIGANLIDLILASTMYRGNTRVITTAQQMIDELLALRR